MYCSRPVSRSPSVYRIIRPSMAGCTRNASFFPTPFIPRSAGSEFAPFLRLLDDFASPRAFDLAPAFLQHARHAPQPFSPRFDLREVGEWYELRGELPGVDSNDLQVEFSDPQTLIVRGKNESEASSGSRPVAAKAVEQTETEANAAPETPATAEAAEKDNSDAASTYSTGSYQRPSVEDADADADAQGAAQSPADAQARAQAVAQQVSQPAPTVEQEQQRPEEPTARYWVSERSTGSFQRVFRFPSRIDQDAVTASLKNGILNIVVPKAAAPVARRINVE